jgi:hypothetical protein
MLSEHMEYVETELNMDIHVDMDIRVEDRNISKTTTTEAIQRDTLKNTR